MFVVSLFKSNFSIYEVHNNGAPYNFGYLFGLACFFGGGGNRAARRKQNPDSKCLLKAYRTPTDTRGSKQAVSIPSHFPFRVRLVRQLRLR